MAFTLNTSAFARALKDRVELVKKDGIEQLNKQAGEVAFKAAKLSPKANRAAIRAGLMNDFQAAKLINVFRATGGFGASFRQVPKWLAAMGTGAPLRGDALGAAAKRLVASAESSAKYIAVGFLKIAKEFGKNVNTKGISDKGLHQKSNGQKASIGKPIARLENFARGAGPVATEALQQSIDLVAADMAAHDAPKIFKHWR